MNTIERTFYNFLPAYITIPTATSVFLIVHPRSKRLSMLKPIRSLFGFSLGKKKSKIKLCHFLF